ncbi:hypothetical protein EBU95_21190, partial [bacterium]|nr:hypothetical protein [bacterium]
KDFKPFVERAASFYSKELIKNTRIRNNCSVKIRFDGKLQEYGYCLVEDYNTAKQARDFLIELHPGIGARRILETLAHEMVHLKQFAFNETNDQLSMWRGEKIDSDKVEYWSHPWEIDAYGRESGLLTKFAISEHLWEILEEFRNPALPIVSTPIKWKNI